jgi:hypothetical protein
MAGENPWGYLRIQGALANLGHEVARNTVKRMLQDHGVDPAPDRSRHTPWKTFLLAHWAGLAAADFFTVEVLTLGGLKRYLVFFVIELQTRRAQIAGIHPQPGGAWVEQMVRTLTDPVDGFLRVRGGFSESQTAWPEAPRVLFVHAPEAADLSRELIDSHIRALSEALAPWSGGRPIIGSDLLQVCEAQSIDDIAESCGKRVPTHAHLLAHGALVPTHLSSEIIWGPRLGGAKRPGVPPKDLAEVMRPRDGLPVVVTFAGCDSGTMDDPVLTPP